MDWIYFRDLCRRFQGQSNVPLNDAECQQATALANRLLREHIDVIFASDLQRAHEIGHVIRPAACL